MAKRKKRLTIRNPEKLQELDEELSSALANLAQRNRETRKSLGKFAPAEADPDAASEAQQSDETETEDETAK